MSSGFTKYRNDYLLLHFVVLLYGLTGILGKLISISAESLVWIRLLIAVAALGADSLFTRKTIHGPGKNAALIFITGAIIAGHWIFFYRSIKDAGVSIAVICLAASTFFTAIAEPLFFKRRIRVFELLIGASVILALYMMFMNELQLRNNLPWTGIGEGVLSAFLAAIFPVLNGKMMQHGEDPLTLSFWELLSGLACLSIALPAMGIALPNLTIISATDYVYLTILALLCTAFTFKANLRVMKNISPYTVVLSINLEPVYSILIAWFVFRDEQMSIGFYAGTALIISLLFMNAWLRKKLFPVS